VSAQAPGAAFLAAIAQEPIRGRCRSRSTRLVHRSDIATTGRHLMPFESGGDACGVCQALDGTSASQPAHDAGGCQSTKDDDDCEYESSSAGPNDRYGSGNYDVVIHVEISVYCNG